MAEPPSDPPPLDIDHDQLKKRAAPAFDDAALAVFQAIDQASAALSALGGWPAREEADKAFVAWFKPKRNEMLRRIREFGGVYEDIADGLVTMQRNVAVVDWGIADDLKIGDVPVYKLPGD